MRNTFLEIRAGTGGDESALFAGDLLRMYVRYAERQGWSTEIVSESPGEVGGYKEVVIRIVGDGVYGKLKFESGGHRVQRVPATETQGRIHTSACTVAALPEPDEAQAVQINPADLRIDTYRASGAGGQHVNKTDSAVRITHIPTGIVAECQDDRSQHRNKAKAMQVLAARIKEKERSERAAKEAATRKGLIGSGDRSDRIRTYNFPQGRLTDHRINLTLYKLQFAMEGELDEVIEGVAAGPQGRAAGRTRVQPGSGGARDRLQALAGDWPCRRRRRPGAGAPRRAVAAAACPGPEPADRAWLLAHDTDELLELQQARFLQLCKRRADGEPLAYIVGHKEFFGLKLQVDPRVLVPRPDTETLVEWALELLLHGSSVHGAPARASTSGTRQRRRSRWHDAEHRAGRRALPCDGRYGRQRRCPGRSPGKRPAAVAAGGVPPGFVAGGQRGPLRPHRQQSALRGRRKTRTWPRCATSPWARWRPGPTAWTTSARSWPQAPAHLRSGGWLLLEHGHDQARAVRDLLVAAGFARRNQPPRPGGHRTLLRRQLA